MEGHFFATTRTECVTFFMHLRFRGRPHRGLPAWSTVGPGSFVRDFFGNGFACPQGARGAYRGGALITRVLIPAVLIPNQLEMWIS